MSSDAVAFVNNLIAQLGTPYSETLGGGVTPGVAFDCLARGTLITTLHGEVPIEHVAADTMVLTRRGYRRVLRAWMVREDAEVLHFNLGNGITLCGTPDHRVWTENRGWVVLKDLSSQDVLVRCNKEAAGNGGECEKYSDVFDLTVEGEHEFFANGVLVHNCSGLIDYCLSITPGSVPLGRTSEDQYAACNKVSLSQLQVGDFIYEQWPGDNYSPGHVITYIGDGDMVIEAAHSGTYVWIREWSPKETSSDGGVNVGYGRDPGMSYDATSPDAITLAAFVASVKTRVQTTGQAYTKGVPDPTHPVSTPVPTVTYNPAPQPTGTTTGPTGRGNQTGMSPSLIGGTIDQSPTSANSLNATDVTSTLISSGLDQQSTNLGCPTVSTPNFVPISFVIVDPATGSVTDREDCIITQFVINTGALSGATITRGLNGTTEQAWPEGSSWIFTHGSPRSRLFTTPGAEPTINVDYTDVAQLFGLDTDITSMSTNLVGNPIDNQKLLIEFLDDGTSRSITWGPYFENSGHVALPADTPAGKRMRVSCSFNSISRRFTALSVS